MYQANIVLAREWKDNSTCQASGSKTFYVKIHIISYVLFDGIHLNILVIVSEINVLLLIPKIKKEIFSD